MSLYKAINMCCVYVNFNTGPTQCWSDTLVVSRGTTGVGFMFQAWILKLGGVRDLEQVHTRLLEDWSKQHERETGVNSWESWKDSIRKATKKEQVGR